MRLQPGDNTNPFLEGRQEETRAGVTRLRARASSHAARGTIPHSRRQVGGRLACLDGTEGERRMNPMEQSETFEQARAGLPDVPPEMSVYWKPLYRLFDDGNPIDPVTILLYDLGAEKRLPFAALAKTRGNRLILWPPSDSREPHEFADGDAAPIHHVTLELSSGETHFTRFEQKSKRVHQDRGWRLADFDGGLKLWLIAAFQVGYLEKQVGVVGGTIRMPRTDSKRRESEFRRYAAELRSALVVTPAVRGDCLVTVFYQLAGADYQGPLDGSHFPMGKFWDDWIADWPDGDKFQAATSVVTVGDVSLLLLTAAPLGQLRGACMLGSVDRVAR